MGILFEEWMKSNESWSKSDFIIRMRMSKKQTMKGSRRWMTEAEIVQKYALTLPEEDSKEVAKEIIQSKVSCPHISKMQVRSHPELPHRKDLTQYLVWDASYETDETDCVVSSLFQCEDSQGKSGKRKKKSKRDSSSYDESESQETSTSSSTTSKKKKVKKEKKGRKSKKNKKDKKKGKKSKKSDDDSGSESHEDKKKPRKIQRRL